MNVKTVVLAGMAALGILSTLSTNTYAADIEVREYTNSDQQYIQYYGSVVEGDDDKLRKLINQNPHIKTVHLTSHGGDTREAWYMAKTLRDNQLNTAVHSYCKSACGFIFMGGAKRYLKENKGKIGIHASHFDNYNQDDSLDDIYSRGQNASARTLYELTFYVESGYEFEMVKLYRRALANSTSKTMYYPSNEELIKANFITETY